MENLLCYKTMPEWDINSLPSSFTKKHNTKKGSWAKLNVLSGSVKYYALDEQGNVLDEFVFDANSDIPFVEPQAWHRVEPLDDEFRCQISFYCEPKDYYSKKYSLTEVHSEALEIVKFVQSGNALDIGCGSGRNSLFLQLQGFDVQAFDRNHQAISNLQDIVAEEGITNLNAWAGDINDFSTEDSFDLAFCTVVMMFLDHQQVPPLIKKMQDATRPGGYNLIVCAIDGEEYPFANYTLPFEFGFKPNELAEYYKDWDIKKYNEDVGHLHRTDDFGNPIALQFATIIAQKK